VHIPDSQKNAYSFARATAVGFLLDHYNASVSWRNDEPGTSGNFSFRVAKEIKNE